jgi:curved DNA-binding protein CbpA
MNKHRGIRQRTSAAENRSPYEVLGVAAEASDEQIRKIYLERVRQSPPERDPEGFKEIRRAYGVLKDGARRRELDLSLYKRDSGLGVAMGSVDFPSLFIQRVFRMLLASSDFRLKDFSRDFLPMDETVSRLR